MSETDTAPVTTGKSLRLFLIDGTAGGLVVAEIMNWTGYVISAERSDLASLLNRPDGDPSRLTVSTASMDRQDLRYV